MVWLSIKNVIFKAAKPTIITPGLHSYNFRKGDQAFFLLFFVRPRYVQRIQKFKKS